MLNLDDNRLRLQNQVQMYRIDLRKSKFKVKMLQRQQEMYKTILQKNRHLSKQRVELQEQQQQNIYQFLQSFCQQKNNQNFETQNYIYQIFQFTEEQKQNFLLYFRSIHITSLLDIDICQYEQQNKSAFAQIMLFVIENCEPKIFIQQIIQMVIKIVQLASCIDQSIVDDFLLQSININQHLSIKIIKTQEFQQYIRNKKQILDKNFQQLLVELFRYQTFMVQDEKYILNIFNIYIQNINDDLLYVNFITFLSLLPLQYINNFITAKNISTIKNACIAKSTQQIKDQNYIDSLLEFSNTLYKVEFLKRQFFTDQIFDILLEFFQENPVKGIKVIQFFKNIMKDRFAQIYILDNFQKFCFQMDLLNNQAKKALILFILKVLDLKNFGGEKENIVLMVVQQNIQSESPSQVLLSLELLNKLLENRFQQNNDIYRDIDECIFRQLESLQHHESKYIYQKANYIIDKFLLAENNQYLKINNKQIWSTQQILLTK